MDWSGVDYLYIIVMFFYQLLGHKFWRHPFTAEDPLVSKWCNAKFLQICSDEETNSSSLDDLRMCKMLANIYFWVNYSILLLYACTSNFLCSSGLDWHFLHEHHVLGSWCMNYHANPEHRLCFFMVITPSQAQLPAFLHVNYDHNPAVLLCHCAVIGLKPASSLPLALSPRLPTHCYDGQR